MEQIKRLDLAGLTLYDQKIKEYVGNSVKAGAPDLSNYFNAPPKYNSESKKIEFYHDSTKVAELDATAFIKDGMVDSVTIAAGTNDNSGKQVILVTFNTDSGKENIELPIEGIFNPANYMTKTETQESLDKKLDSSTYNSEKEDFATKTELNKKLDASTYNSEKEDFLTESDLAGYVQDTDLTAITTAEIEALFK